MREYSALWARRQGADLLGMTYDKFIDFAFESHLNVKRKKLPRPNQLLSGAGAEIVLDYINAKWQDLMGGKLATSDLTQYRNQFYIGLPAQDAHRKSVAEGLKFSEHSIKFALAREQLTDQDIELEYGVEPVARAREAINSNPGSYATPVKAIDRADLYPGCFQFPFAYNANGPVCSRCPLRAPCAQSSENYFDSRTALHLGVNGYDDRRRKLASERQRRRREKLRTLAPPNAALT